MKQMNDITLLLQTVKASTSPFHAVEYAKKQLEDYGFSQLQLGDQWDLALEQGYYINAFGSTLIAFRANSDFMKDSRCRIAAAHTDWPCLRVKPSPEIGSGKYGKLNVEVYGGPILNTWCDRPLSLSGRITFKGSSIFEPQTKLIDFDRTLLTIPNLAIHLNREVNKGVELNPQLDMLPLLTMVKSAVLFEDGNYFMELLSKESHVPVEDILDYELYIYNREEGEQWGVNQEFISAPRLDNLTSVQACITGLLTGNRSTGLDVIALFDNEEIGSHTKQGADSSLLANVLEQIYISFDIARSVYISSMFASILLSIDVSHGIHPNKPEKSDMTNRIYLNDGFSIKMNCRQAYATDSSAIAIIQGIANEYQIPYNKFANRSDVTGGGTLGSIASARLAMKAVDIGVPMLAMHSARETMGSMDQKSLVKLVNKFFTV